MNVDNVDNVAENKTLFLGFEQQQFINYVRAKMLFSLILRTENNEMQAIHIPSTEINDRFFPYPLFNRRLEINKLIDLGELKVIEKNKCFYYQALKSGAIDLNLLTAKAIPTDTFYKVMIQNLKSVSLSKKSDNIETYFDVFLNFKDVKPELFFVVDGFSQRVHTPISSLSRVLRPLILLDNQETTSFDVATMQPLLLGKFLTKHLVNNQYSNWINEGKDIYLMLQQKAGLKNRDEAKKKFFEIAYGKPSKDLAKMFGSSDWINLINQYKTTPEPRNPHGKEKPHSNLAWLLQTTEVEVMQKIWKQLVFEKIIFLSVHDEIICKKQDAERVRQIMDNVLKNEFTFYKLSGEKKVLFLSTLSTLPTLENEETALKPPKSNIPPEVIELQKFYSDLEQADKIPEEFRKQIGTLWQGVQIYLNNPMQLPLYTQQLTELKQQLITQ